VGFCSVDPKEKGKKKEKETAACSFGWWLMAGAGLF
jgi:hypothetical protein